jgi:hypothetical protein
MSGGGTSLAIVPRRLGVFGENQLVALAPPANASVFAVASQVLSAAACSCLGSPLAAVVSDGEPLPVVEIATRERGVVADHGVVGLRAQAGRRPVGRAEQHRLGSAVAIDVDDVLVVADLTIGKHPVDQLAGGLREPLPRRRVAVGDRACALLVGRARVREDQMQALASALECADQLVVAELVERGVKRTARLGAGDEGEQRRDHVAGEALAQRALRLGDRGEQRRLRGLAAERVRDPLGRDQPAAEDGGDAGRDDWRDRNLVRGDKRDLHRLQLPGCAGEGNDLVAKAPRAGPVGDEARGRVLPVELLHREGRGRLAGLGDEPGKTAIDGSAVSVPAASIR